MSVHVAEDRAELRFPMEPRRRRRRWLILALVLSSGALVAAVTGEDRPDPAFEPTAAGPSEPTEAPSPGAGDRALSEAGEEPSDEPDTQRSDATAGPALPPLLGAVDGLELRLPADEAVVVGFHEASSASHAIEPIGRLVANHNTTRYEAPPARDDGVDHHILASRGRVPAPTSAVDIVLRDRIPVRAPVDGTVADVRSYRLYGEYPDHRIEIHPDDAPRSRVVLIHVADVQVRAGERVEAGTSVLAGSANRFPFASQIDRETDPERWAHVHLEVQPIDAPRPGDPPEG